MEVSLCCSHSPILPEKTNKKTLRTFGYFLDHLCPWSSMKGLEHSSEAEFCLSVHPSACSCLCAGICPSVHKSGIICSFSDLCDLRVVLWEGRKCTCHLCTMKVSAPAILWQPSWVTKRRVIQLMRNVVARSSTAAGFSRAMWHTVLNILACQCKCQSMVSGVYTHKAMNKAALTDRCSSCLYILLLGVWYIQQR